jgi:trypsin
MNMKETFQRMILVVLAWLIATIGCAVVDGQVAPRIIGGYPASNGRYPYAQVSLQYTDYHYCGGTLLAPDLVLTAYHCWDNFDAVEFHRYDFTDASEATETIPASGLFWHPDYNEDYYHHDVLIVKLLRPVSLSDTVQPVRINHDPNVPVSGQELTVVGWGQTNPSTDDDDSFPSQLQEVALKYIPPDVCERITNGPDDEFAEYLTSDMMCAGAVGKDACYGDSGGPLILMGDNPEEDVQVGLVSWGITCAGDFPGVFSRLSESYDWIRATVCEESRDPPAYFECGTDAPIGDETTKPPTSLNTCSCNEKESTQMPSLINMEASPSSAPSSQNGDRPTVVQVDATNRVPSIDRSSASVLNSSGCFGFLIVLALILP